MVRGGDVLVDLSRKSVGEYTRWTELNGSIKAIISRPNSEWELVDS
jgi:hypothetical protein